MESKNPGNKEFILAGITIISAVVFGLLLRSFSWQLALLGWILFLTAFLIQSIFTRAYWLIWLSIAISIISVTGIFYEKTSLAIIVGAALAVVLFAQGYHNGQLELKNNLEIRFFSTAEEILKRASSGLAIFTIFIYLSHLINLQDPAFGKRAIASMLKPSEALIAQYLPGVPVSNSSVVDILYQASFGKFIRLPSLQQQMILIVIGLLVFFTVKLALIILDWLVKSAGWAVYQILWGAKFFTIELQTKSKKVIII